MTPDQAAAKMSAAIARIVKENFQRAGYELQAAVEGHVDEQGPPRGKRSTSHQWGKQTGRASRSFIPGQEENISRIVTGGRVSYTFGTRTPYVRFLEEGTSRMIARPAVGPGFKDYERSGWPRRMSIMLEQITQEFNG